MLWRENKVDKIVKCLLILRAENIGQNNTKEVKVFKFCINRGDVKRQEAKCSVSWRAAKGNKTEKQQRTQEAVIRSACCVLSRFSCVQLFVTLWTIARQTSLSMGFSRQEYQSGLPCLSPRDLSDPGIKPRSHVSCIGRWVLYQDVRRSREYGPSEKTYANHGS